MLSLFYYKDSVFIIYFCDINYTCLHTSLLVWPLGGKFATIYRKGPICTWCHGPYKAQNFVMIWFKIALMGPKTPPEFWTHQP